MITVFWFRRHNDQSKLWEKAAEIKKKDITCKS